MRKAAARILLSVAVATASVALVAPAASGAPAGKQRTTITGWDTTPATVIEGTVLSQSLTVSGKKGRVVQVQTKAKKKWKKVRNYKTAKGGAVTVSYTPPVGVSQWRVSVAGTRTGKPAATGAQTVTVDPLPQGNTQGIDIAKSALGPGVSVQSATFTGPEGSLARTPDLFATPATPAGFRAKAADTPVPTGSGLWMLSTGNVSDAANTVGYFASANKAAPGNDTLSTLAGYGTSDAAYLDLTITPKAPTLRVKYRFASEEYNEYVGTPYNDVMAIFVNGVNCALVPGTATPIAINNVNAGANSGLYVNNEALELDGDPATVASAVAYDGFTVPLECTVAVTPGTPVAVQIAIADASDGIYDSAFALLDKGISAS